MMRVHLNRRERQSCLRTRTVMALHYLKTLQRYNSALTSDVIKHMWAILRFFFHDSPITEFTESWMAGGERGWSQEWKVRFSCFHFFHRLLSSQFISWNQQLSPDECRAARGRWNHMGERWAAYRKPGLQIQRWWDSPTVVLLAVQMWCSIDMVGFLQFF